MVSIRKAWCNAVVIMIALWSNVALAAEPSKPVEAPVPRASISEADRLGLPPTPAYVTAWPRQVEVEKPDPVLGDKPFQEIWAYNKEFAKRFKNLPSEGATEDFSPGAYALVFRVYKTVLWKSFNYPPQYACEYDLYFDNSVRIPLSERPIKVVPQYPPGFTESYRRLEPVSESDRQALANAKASPFEVQQWPAIFADGPLDGRFATFGVGYYPDLAPGMSMVRFSAMRNSEAIAPKRDGTHLWLSLFGKHPYLEGPRGKAFSGSYMRGVQGSFKPGPTSDKEGYFRMPEVFYHAVLPKVTLVKALNDCIGQRYSYALPNKGSAETWAKVFAACEDMEQNGTIYEVIGGRVREGLPDIGF